MGSESHYERRIKYVKIGALFGVGMALLIFTCLFFRIFYGPPLHISVELGNYTMAKYFIDRGADVNEKAEFSELTPLELAVSKGNYAITKLLIENGAAINSFYYDSGDYPIHFAAEYGKEDIVELLIEKGADINCLNGSMKTPLSLAVSNGHKETAGVLIKNGVNVNFPIDGYGNYPLHIAAEKGNIEIIKLLLDSGADINRRNKLKEPPLLLAIQNGHKDVAEFLRSRGGEEHKELPPW